MRKRILFVIISALSLVIIYFIIQMTHFAEGVQEDTAHQKKLTIAKKYYGILNTSEKEIIDSLFADEVSIQEMDYQYEQKFNVNQYKKWMQWDSIFEPDYVALEIETEGDIVIAKISKNDIRIQFLHEQPIITNEIIRFENNRIKSIQRFNIQFNDSVFSHNRETFLNWVKEHHPELNNFIHDQTIAGGLEYLKAIKLFKSNRLR